MNQWLKDQLPTLVVGAMVVIIIILLFQKKDNAAALTNYQIDQLKTEMKGVILHEFDSLKNVVASPIPVDFSHADSLQQIALDLNSKIIYELRKKNERRIDTVNAADLKSIFEEYGRQHPISSNSN